MRGGGVLGLRELTAPEHFHSGWCLKAALYRSSSRRTQPKTRRYLTSRSSRNISHQRKMRIMTWSAIYSFLISWTWTRIHAKFPSRSFAVHSGLSSRIRPQANNKLLLQKNSSREKRKTKLSPPAPKKSLAAMRPMKKSTRKWHPSTQTRIPSNQFPSHRRTATATARCKGASRPGTSRHSKMGLTRCRSRLEGRTNNKKSRMITVRILSKRRVS